MWTFSCEPTATRTHFASWSWRRKMFGGSLLKTTSFFSGFSEAFRMSEGIVLQKLGVHRGWSLRHSFLHCPHHIQIHQNSWSYDSHIIKNFGCVSRHNLFYKLMPPNVMWMLAKATSLSHHQFYLSSDHRHISPQDDVAAGLAPAWRIMWKSWCETHGKSWIITVGMAILMSFWCNMFLPKEFTPRILLAGCILDRLKRLRNRNAGDSGLKMLEHWI